jgi:hypothetical protein
LAHTNLHWISPILSCPQGASETKSTEHD